MANFPPLLFGIKDIMPPNMMTLMVWRKVLGINTPVTLHFPVMPESYMMLKKYLTTVTPTRDGGWVDDYGPAPSPMTISGTFGYRTKGLIGGGVYNGFGWIKILEWMVDISHEPDDEGVMPEVWMMSHASQHYYEVELMDFNIAQNVNRNMLWVYELKMTTLGLISDNPLADTILGAIAVGIKAVGSAVKDIAKVSI